MMGGFGRLLQPEVDAYGLHVQIASGGGICRGTRREMVPNMYGGDYVKPAADCSTYFEICCHKLAMKQEPQLDRQRTSAYPGTGPIGDIVFRAPVPLMKVDEPLYLLFCFVSV